MKKCFTHIEKDSSYLRAIFKSYKKKSVAYCGRKIQQRDMHIDHIIPSNKEKIDDEVRGVPYKLQEKGFVVDSIENYLPSCPACNIDKTNRIFTSSNLRFIMKKYVGILQKF